MPVNQHAECWKDPCPTCTEEYRRLCEALYVHNLGAKARKIEYIKGVGEQRGAAAAEQLLADVMEMQGGTE